MLFLHSKTHTDIMKLTLKTILGVFASLICLSANAQFMDTGKPENFFRLGVRVGLNMSNVSAGGPAFTWNDNSWGTGFEGGIVAEMSIREWFQIQPGIFYQSRSNNYTHILGSGPDQQISVGHTLYYAFYIPVMLQARFNVTQRLRWSIEAGPYISFGLGHNDNGLRIEPSPQEPFDMGYFDRHEQVVGGLKLGTGLELNEHYYLGIHYMAGFGNAWKVYGMSGHNKAWTFTLGYNF